MLAVRHFFKRATEQVEAAIARTRAPGPPGDRLPGGGGRGAAAGVSGLPGRRGSTSAPATEIYEQNTVAAARRVRELIDEGTRAGAFRQVPAGFVGEVVTATMRRITSGEIAAATGSERRRGVHGARSAGGRGHPPMTPTDLPTEASAALTTRSILPGWTTTCSSSVRS